MPRAYQPGEKPNNRRSSFISTVASVALAGVTIGGLAGTLDNQPQHAESQSTTDVDIPSDAAVLKRKPTKQEAVLAGALERSIMTREVRVDCTPLLPARMDNNSGQEVQGFVRRSRGELPGRTPVIHIGKTFCDGISEYIDYIRQGAPAWDRGGGLYVLVHEAEHLELSSSNEARVSCAAIQRMRTFTKSLGADKASQKNAMFTSLAAYENQPPDYISNECRPGGKYDLDPGHKGDFPNR